MTTLSGWLNVEYLDEVKARPKDSGDKEHTDSAHRFIIEVGGVKVPLTQDQAHDLYGDLGHCFMDAVA